MENPSQELLDHLSTFISENRKEKFHHLIQFRTKHLTVVLEDIFQPHNASAVLRSCDCFGIQDVHIIENRNKYEINPDVALGSSKWLTLNKYNQEKENTLPCINKLKKEGYTIIATSPHKNDVNIENLDIKNKTALVFGTEMQGISDVVKEQADGFVKIPMYGFTESFNISVSAAISLYALTNKLHHSTISWKLSEAEKNKVLLQWFRNSINKPEHIEEDFLKKHGK